MSTLPTRRSTRPMSTDPLVQLQNDVNDLFERVFRGWPLTPAQESRTIITPALDIQEDEERYYLSVELPGVDRQDVAVEVSNGILRIRGEKREEGDPATRRTRVTERYYGPFAREVTLPQDADLEHLKAELKRGVLTVTIPKVASANARTIPIEGE
ncbi:MAG: Hsp20/alpha crystallin family protein [Firmicutes bacterium]|nr:Hsp20/alpha crystallin family protein [Bacillota bacterium]